MTQEQKTQKTSIDDITPEQWDSLRAKEVGRDSKFQVQWLDEEYVPNEHPVFGKPVDMVDNPPHYTQGNIECIDAMEAMLSEEEFIGFLRGNSFKYRWRMRDKRQPVQDLRKAQWYEKKLKDIFENKGTLDAV